MNLFSYIRPQDVSMAVAEMAREPRAKFIAGGTNLLDLMKETVTQPNRLIDINQMPLAKIEALEGGGLMLGALMTNADTAYHEWVESRYPLLSRAILAGASPQLRNMATNGGNLLQRTRCYYFYDVGTACNKREPGSGCPAMTGLNRMHAIFGSSEHCIAVHPSDFCVALAALEAQIHVQGPNSKRVIPMAEFHRLPGDQPDIDTTLAMDELITGIELPKDGFADHYRYIKIRDRESYAFALVSVAAALRMDGDTIVEARLAMGGVAHRPWRDPAVEALLRGKRATAEIFREAAALMMQEARGYEFNSFKIELGRRAIVRALQEASEGKNSQP